MVDRTHAGGQLRQPQTGTLTRVDDADLALRNRTYGLFVDLGRAPTVDEVAASMGATRARVAAGWRRLHDDHALVLQARGTELRMANPFSAVPTAHRVHAAERWWFANCAWDAFGILAALDVDGRIETACPDCGTTISIEVTGRRPDDDGLWFHCLLPAVSWWDDIAFT